jgi:Tfp pilus assembly protein PilX
MITFRQNRKIRNSNTKHRQRGVALIAALLTLVLIAAITAGMIILSTTETSISANFRDEQTAFFSSKAGMEEARDRLSAFRTANSLPTAVPGAAGGALYVVNPNAGNGETQNSILTTYGDDEICKETQATAVPCANNAMGQLVATPGNWETTTLASNVYLPPAGQVLPWKWVRVNLKLNNQNNAIAPSYNVNGNPADTSVVCWNGINEYADPLYAAGACSGTSLPVYVVTALAVTPSGTRRMVQAELAEQKFPFTAPGALTLDGPGDVYSGGSSNQWGVSGSDAAGCGIATTGPAVHGIAVTDQPNTTTVDLGTKRPGNITGSGTNMPSGANIVDVSMSTGDKTLPPSMQTVSNLQQLVSTLKADATQPVINGPASGLANPGTQVNPQIIYVNGDLNISGNTVGYGVLVVTGNLTISGTPNWNGIILVVGKGNFTTSGTAQYNGAVVVANTLDALGHPLATFGPSTVTVNGGGHGGFQYSSGCIAMATRQIAGTFMMTAIRELMR